MSVSFSFFQRPRQLRARSGSESTDLLALFSWDLFDLVDEFTLRLGTSADVAERYVNLGVGLGIWH